jgi:hypothetical protein
VYNGQANLEKEQLEGIGRSFYHDTKGVKSELFEGQSKESKAHGFGRTLKNNGDYHMGWYKEGKRHGYGKALTGTKTEEGLFKEDKYIGGDTPANRKKLGKEDEKTLEKFIDKNYLVHQQYPEELVIEDYIKNIK